MSIVLEIKYGVGQGKAEGLNPVMLRTAFERTGKELRRPMHHIGPELSKALEQSLRTRFAREGDGGPVAGKWVPLSKAYKAWKDIHYPGRKKLVRRGMLRAALTSSASPNALRETSDTALAFGTKGIEYASFHQTGTYKMPARPPFDFGGPEFDRSVRKAVQTGIRNAVRAARAEDLLR